MATSHTRIAWALLLLRLAVGGMVPVEDVIGSPVLRYWPLGRVGGMGDIAHSSQLASIPAGTGQ